MEEDVGEEGNDEEGKGVAEDAHRGKRVKCVFMLFTTYKLNIKLLEIAIRFCRMVPDGSEV